MRFCSLCICDILHGTTITLRPRVRSLGAAYLVHLIKDFSQHLAPQLSIWNMMYFSNHCVPFRISDDGQVEKRDESHLVR